MKSGFVSRVSVLTLLFSLLPVLGRCQVENAETVQDFNQKFTDDIRRMDNAATLKLWADDGVSLLPGMAPISGIAAIRKFMEDVTDKTRGFKVLSHENKFHDIQVSGDWASEWAETEQVVQQPSPKPILIIHGKMLLVLHRDKSGEWKIKEEAWTNSPGR